MSFYPPLLDKLVQALQHCKIQELVPLMEIPGVKIARAKQVAHHFSIKLKVTF